MKEEAEKEESNEQVKEGRDDLGRTEREELVSQERRVG